MARLLLPLLLLVLAPLGLAQAPAPRLLNNADEYRLTEGSSFTLRFSGCASGCTISLENGPSSNLDKVKILTTSATGNSFSFVPSGLPSDTYAFKITDNASGQFNFSPQFSYQGSGAPRSAASSAPSSAPAASSSSPSSEASIRSDSDSTSSTIIRPATLSPAATLTRAATLSPARSLLPTIDSSTTTAPSRSTDPSSFPASTIVPASPIPQSGACHLASPLAFVAGFMVLMAGHLVF